ncbi:MAG: hypothetical protein BGO01_17230 [Armatimonadetes bacterium 55-13]|nr:PadR family transcriptional regulator [Armatimonadota bacterium]ODU52318.1 MAG: hypothetical protein ABT09_02800 [bacterium SCN 57-13]OJU63896.1 MAG: hypothetical protein BGO01_17230 [Armatimonadetes bacterium 55-13]
MSLDRPLSTLEMTALGIILKSAPCNAHAVLINFANSKTSAYRSGAGSIYPLLKRLTDASYLSLENKKYSLTESGLQAIREWILPPFGPNDISTNLDVLRSRVYFLKLLTPPEIKAFLDESRSNLQALLQDCQEITASYQTSGDRFSELAMLGAVRETEARIAWIEEIAQALS